MENRKLKSDLMKPLSIPPKMWMIKVISRKFAIIIATPEKQICEVDIF
jgi:hypothetical protein